MKHTINGYVYYVKYSWNKEGKIDFSATKLTGSDYTLIGEQTIEVDLPDSFSPIALQSAALKRELEDTKKVFIDRINSIKEQISKLECIEMVDEVCNGI